MDIDQIVAEWNAALESGNADRIAAAKRAALSGVAHLTMADSPNYAAAGYKAAAA